MNPSTTKFQLLSALSTILAAVVFFGSAERAVAQTSNAVPHQTIPQRGSSLGPYADIPKDSWVYPAVVTLLKHRLAPGAFNYGGPKAFTRYEAAIFTARVLDHVNSYFRTGAGRPEIISSQEPVHFNLSDVGLLRKLVMEFTAELQSLGVEPTVTADILRKMEIAASDAEIAAQPFPDVPSMHWAASSVEQTRQAGIFIGYPGHTFNPSNHSPR